MNEHLSLAKITEKIARCQRKMEILDLQIAELEEEVAALQAEPNYVRTKKKVKTEKKIPETP